MRGSAGGLTPDLGIEGDAAPLPLLDILEVKDYISNKNVVRKY